jgi:hypothetical protein
MIKNLFFSKNSFKILYNKKILYVQNKKKFFLESKIFKEK